MLLFRLILPVNMMRPEPSQSACSPLCSCIKQREPREIALWHQLIARDICWQCCISLCVKSPLWGRQGKAGREGEEGRVCWLWKKLEIWMRNELQSMCVHVCV